MKKEANPAQNCIQKAKTYQILFPGYLCAWTYS